MLQRLMLVLLSLLVLTPAASAAEAPEPSYTPIDCGFKMRGIELTCGYVEVPENRARPGGRSLPIHFIRAGATGEDSKPDPIVFLGGGPGLHATPGANGVIYGNRKLLAERDLIVVDQRGTGRSNPLDCIEHGDDAGAEVVRRVFEIDFFDGPSFDRCLRKLSEVADLTQYTTTASVEDLEEVRRALGYEQVNLSGGSYGTRWALEYMRRYPESIRSAVLYGVAPPSELLVERVAMDFQRDLDATVAACEADNACAARYPGFRKQLATLLATIREKPVEVEIRSGGEQVPVTMNYEQFVTAMRFSLYSVHMAAALPARVDAAAQGDYTSFADSVSALSVPLHNSVAEGLWASVKCAEELPFIDEARARKQSTGTALGLLRLESELEVCEVWPRGKVPEDFNQPVRSAVPALLLAGEFDTATPLELAEKAVRHLPNGRLVSVPNRSHWGLRGGCIDEIVAQFLDSGSAESVDDSCAAGYERPPFVIN